MPADTTIRSIRKNYSLKSVTGLTRKVSLCPLPFHSHEKNTPSFSIFIGDDGVERWNCFGSCQKHGDVVDFVGYMKIPRYDPASSEDVKAAISLLIAGYEMAPSNEAPRKRAPLPYDFHKMFPLKDEVIEYARTRGIQADTLHAFGVGQADKKTLSDAYERVGLKPSRIPDSIFMAMPTFHFGTLMMIKFRNIRPGPRFFAFPGSTPGLFNMVNVFNTPYPVALIKGEIPVMVLWERGIAHTCAPSGGEVTIDERWGVYTTFSSRKIVVGDNDPQKIKDQLASAYEKRCKVFNAQLYYPPEQYKDVDQWVLSDFHALEQIQTWMFEGVDL